MDAFIITLFLGTVFLLCQGVEYYASTFNISDSVYACTFFMLTGLHGMHVMVGTVFLLVCFMRLLYKHFTYRHYLGFVFAIWYWHFVDAVWILLFLSLYCWGSW